jgi:hypothetical protein
LIISHKERLMISAIEGDRKLIYLLSPSRLGYSSSEGRKHVFRFLLQVLAVTTDEVESLVPIE